MASLNYNIEETETGYEVSWNDVRPIIETSKPFAMILAFLGGTGFISLVATLFLTKYYFHNYLLAYAMISLAIVGLMAMGLKMGLNGTIARHLKIENDCLKFEEATSQPKKMWQEIPLKDITRITYGKRSEWDQSDRERNHFSQIRIWVLNDIASYVLSENEWTTEVNHKLHGLLNDLFSKLKADRFEEQHTSEAAAENTDFGLPDY